MVGIISGNGLGLLNTSMDVLGKVDGEAGVGQGKAYVNTANGNLSVQFLDGVVSGSGADMLALRTYNSSVVFSNEADGDGDGWRWQGENKISLVSGVVNTTGSLVMRILSDGSSTIFKWDDIKGKYISKNGSDSHDSITWTPAAGTKGSEWMFVADDKNDVKEYYNGTTGWIKSVRDAGGNGFNYTYTGNKLTKILDIKSLQTLEFVYDANGMLGRIDTNTIEDVTAAVPKLILTSRTYYAYDANSRLRSVKTDLSPADSKITDNNIYETTYTYEGNSKRIASITQSDGTTASFTYYTDGKIKTASDRSGTTTFSYTTVGATTNTTTVTTGAGDVFVYTCDANGQILRVESAPVNGVKQSSAYTYDTSGNVKTITDGRNNTTSYVYDFNGNRIQESDSEGLTVTRVFSGTNQLLNETRYKTASAFGSDSETTRYAYDDKNRLRFTVSAEGRVSEIRYGLYGLVKDSIQYVDAKFSLDSLSSADVLSEAQMTSWLSSISNTSKVQQTNFTYDLRGNLSKKINYAVATKATGGTLTDAADQTEYVYSENSQLLQTIADRGSNRLDKKLLSSMAYDGLGRLTSLINETGNSTTVYNGTTITVSNKNTGLNVVSTTDSAGRLTSISNIDSTTGIGRVTKYTYDAAGRLRTTEDAVGARSFVFYDAAGRVSHKVDAVGAVVAYTYDADGRVLVETKYATNIAESVINTWTTATKAPAITLDAINDRKTTYTYDKKGRLETTTIDGIANSIINTYDNESRLVQTTQGDRVTTYYYDKDGLLLGTLDAESSFSENIYDGVGRLIKTNRYKFGSSLGHAVDFSMTQSFMAGRGLDMAKFGVPDWVSVQLSSYYFYDAEGRQVGFVDEQGMLTETVYDAVANKRKTIQYLANITVTANDKLTDLKAKAIAIKADSAQTTTTNFDDFGRIANVVNLDGTANSSVTHYIYDSAGRLVRKVEAEGTIDQRASRIRYNVFSEITGAVNEVDKANLSIDPTAAELTTAINNFGTTYIIDSAGRKVAQLGALDASDKPQPKTFLFYNKQGQLTYTVNALGEVSKTTYNAFGQITNIYIYSNRISDVNMKSITTGGLESTLLALLPSADSLLDVFTSTDYNKLGLVDSLRTNDQTIQNLYDDYGQLRQQSTVSNSDVNSASFFQGLITEPNRPNKVTKTSFEYDFLGRTKNITRDVDGLAVKTSTSYDGFGRVQQTIDANGNVTSVINGTTMSVTTDAIGQHNKLVDAFGRTTSTFDGIRSDVALNQTNYVYDDVNRKITISTGLGATTISTWQTRTGETLKVQDGDGNVTRYTYTKDGKLDQTFKTINSVEVLDGDNEYDNNGRLFEAKDANGVTTRYTYDAANRLILKAIDPNGLNIRCQYKYDGAGRQLTVTEGFGTAAAQITQYTYGSNNKVKDVVVSGVAGKGSSSTLFAESSSSNTQLVQKGNTHTNDQINQNTLIGYDKLGRKVFETSSAAKLNITSSYAYDANGNLTKIIDPRGSSTWRLYKGNLLEIEITSTGSVKQWVYDDAGRVVQIIEYANTISTDSLGSGDNVRNTFKLPSASSKDRSTRYVYSNSSNQLHFVVDSMGVVTEKTYDKAGNILSLTLFSKAPNLAGNYSETNINNLIDRSDVGNRTTRFTYDVNNRVHYTIDPLNNLSERIYDAVGNLITTTQYAISIVLTTDFSEAAIKLALTAKVPGDLLNTIATNPNNVITHYAYDNNNRLRFSIDALGAVTENVYDVFGNITATTKFNSLSSLTAFTEGVIDKAVNRLDPDNRTTHFVYDFNNKLRYTLEPTVATFLQVTENIYEQFSGNLVTKIQYDSSFDLNDSADFSEVNIDSLALSKRSSVNNRITHYVYDNNNRMRFAIDALGFVTENTYDLKGNITATTLFNTPLKLNLLTDFNETTINNSVDRTDTLKLNRTTKYSYDLNSRLTITTDAEGNDTENVYNFAGEVVQIIQHNGKVKSTSVGSISGAFSNGFSSSVKDAVDIQCADTASATRIARLSKSGDLWVAEGGQEFKVAENVDSFQINGNRIGVLKNGTLYAYAGALNNALTSIWNEEYSNVTSFQLEGDRIGVITSGLFQYKVGGLDAVWFTFDSQFLQGIKSFQLDGTRVGVLDSNGTLFVKDDTSNWTTEENNISDFQLEGNRIGILINGTLHIKEGDLSGIWQEQLSNVNKFQLEGKRIAALVDGILYAREPAVLDSLKGINDVAPNVWQNELGNVSSFKMAGKRLVIRTLDSILFMKEGALNAGFTTLSNVQGYALSETSLGFIGGPNNAGGLDDRITTYTYDNAGRQIKTTLPGWFDPRDGQVYAGNENQSARFQRTIEVVYDSFGNAVRNKTRTGLNDFVYQYKVYDKSGQEKYEIDALGYVTRKNYNALGQISSIRRFATSIYTASTPVSDKRLKWSLSELDQFSSTNSISGSLSTNTPSSYRDIFYGYDKLGRKIDVRQLPEIVYNTATMAEIPKDVLDIANLSILPSSLSTQYRYNNFGELINEHKWIDGSSAADTNYCYDKLGRKTWVVDAEGYGTEYRYSFGSQTTIEYANKPTITRDSAGMLTGTPIANRTNDSTVSNFDRWAVAKFDLLGRIKTISHLINNDVNFTIFDTKNYNAFGEVSESFDASNHLTSMEYNHLGKLTKITEPSRLVSGSGMDVFKSQLFASPITIFEYNAFGEGTTQTHFSNLTPNIKAVVSHIFDFAGHEIQTIDALGNGIKMEYDVAGHVITQKQKVDVGALSQGEMSYTHTIEKRFEYDVAGRQISAFDIYNDGTQKSGQFNKYNAFGEIIENRKFWGSAAISTKNLLTGANSASLNSYKYDDAGRLILTVNNDGFTHFYYDGMGNVTRKEQRALDLTDKQRITEVVYDKLGRSLRIKTPKYEATASDVLPNANNITTKTPIVTLTYDRWGNVLSRSNNVIAASEGFSPKTIYTYNQNNQVLTETNQKAKTIDYTATLSERDTFLVHSYVYDILGNVKQDNYSAYEATNSGQFVLGQQIGTTHSTVNDYNDAGQLTKTTDATGVVFTEYTYDINGNQVGSRNALGNVTVDKFNLNNQITGHYILRLQSTIDPQGTDIYTGTVKLNWKLSEFAVSEFYYDQAGRTYGIVDSLGGMDEYKFDERGNIVEENGSNFNVKMYAFDEFNHKISEKTLDTDNNANNPLIESSWTYDHSNFHTDRIQNHTVGGSTYSYSYSDFGQLKKETLINQSNPANTYEITYDYWLNGLQSSVAEHSVVDGSTKDLSTKTWYDLNANVSIVNTSSRYFNTSLGFDLTSKDNITTYQYDTQNRLTVITSPKATLNPDVGKSFSTTNLTSLEFHYDEWGNRRKINTSYMLPNNTAVIKKEEWYAYDNANRVLVESGALDVVNKTAVAFRELDDQSKDVAKGIVYVYDNAGRRKTQESWNKISSTIFGSGRGEEYSKLTYSYNSTGLVERINKITYIRKNGSSTSDNTIANIANARDYKDQTGAASTGDIELNTYSYDKDANQLRAFKWISGKTDSDKGQFIETDYNSSGRITLQVAKEVASNKTQYVNSSYQYDGAGSLKFYRQEIKTSDGNTPQSFTDYVYDYVNTYQGRQVDTITSKDGSTKQDPKLTATTKSRYDNRGHLIGTVSSNKDGVNKSQKFLNNTSGQIIVKSDIDKNNNYKIQNYYYTSSNAELANIGDNTADISPLTAIYEGGDAPSTYTVNAGDTLMSVSQTLFGDAKLWYLIADANGLSLGPTDEFSSDLVGRNLTIPSYDKTISNTSNNFKPYNAGEVIGDQSPVLPAPKKKGCNAVAKVISTIIQIVVTIVVTIYTFGNVAAGSAAGAAAGNYSNQYLSMMLEGDFDWKNFGKHLLNPLSGNRYDIFDPLHSGAEREVDYTGIAISAAAGYIGGAVGGTGFIGGAATYVADNRLNKLAGRDPSFSLRGMLVSAVAAEISSKFGPSNTATGGTLEWGSFNWGAMVEAAQSSATNAVIQYGVGKAIDPAHTHWNGGEALLDAFGNAMASGIVRKVATPQSPVERDTSQDWNIGDRQPDFDYAGKPILLASTDGGASAGQGKLSSAVAQEAAVADDTAQSATTTSSEVEEIVVTGFAHNENESQLPWYQRAWNYVKGEARSIRDYIVAPNLAARVGRSVINGLNAFNEALSPPGYQEALKRSQETLAKYAPIEDRIPELRRSGQIAQSPLGAAAYFVANQNGASEATQQFVLDVGGFAGAMTMSGAGLRGVAPDYLGATRPQGFNRGLPTSGLLADAKPSNVLYNLRVDSTTATNSIPEKPSAYSVAYEMKLDPADFGKSRSVHFNRANASLDNALQVDQKFAQMMDELIPGVQPSVSSVGGRTTPAGWTWEHASTSTASGQQGVMRLVPAEQHTPGSAFWRILHPDVGASGGYSEWAIPNGAPKN